MMTSLFNYRSDDMFFDVRALPTRRHNGRLFKEIIIKHHKARHDPLYRTIQAWNDLLIIIRIIEHKELHMYWMNR